jgi:GAF domain-containing protein
MVFALQLRESLEERHGQLEQDVAAGDNLRTILTRYLLAVEDAADTELLTSILLLDEDGLHLNHAAAPRLPKAYCDAIDGTEIGPSAGSCGTAAFVGHPIYVVDIDTDPLWANYRELALAHGLRACWSTPILDGHTILGTFAIYHRTPRSPTAAEVQAIAMISDRVAAAITMCRTRATEGGSSDRLTFPAFEDLRLVRERLDDNSNRLRNIATIAEPEDLTRQLREVAQDCRSILSQLRSWTGRPN